MRGANVKKKKKYLAYFIFRDAYDVHSNTFNLLFSLFPNTETFNPLTLELDIYSLAHHLCKMWIFYEPRRVALGNNTTFCGRINEDGERKSRKIIRYIC